MTWYFKGNRWDLRNFGWITVVVGGVRIGMTSWIMYALAVVMVGAVVVFTLFLLAVGLT